MLKKGKKGQKTFTFAFQDIIIKFISQASTRGLCLAYQILVVKGVAVWPNALKREICDKNIFSDNVEWSYEKLQKMISADLKTDVKQYEQRPGPINLYEYI